MRRKLHANQQDSLELLLDTLCNVFGGIILIACLLAMLSRPKSEKPPPVQIPERLIGVQVIPKIPPIKGQQAGVQAPSPLVVKPDMTPRPLTDNPTDRKSGIIAEKRIEMAQAELDGLQKLRAQLQSEDDPSLRPLISELAALKKTAEKLRQEKAKQDEIATAKAKQMVRDIGDEVARLREQEQEIERKLAIANKDTEAARQLKSALEKRLADLQLELENVDDLKIEKLRFPRERQINKTASPIIVQYGQVFPVFDGGGEPTPMVNQVPSPDGSFTAFAKQGEGLSPNLQTKQLREILKQLGSGSRYLTLYVYPDSYATLRELKKLIYELGVDYGLDLRTENSRLVFDPKGAKPAPL